MDDKYIIAHDVGTGGDKAILTDLSGRALYSSYQSYEVQFPSQGAAEQDPEVLWQAFVQTTKDIFSKTGIDPIQVEGVGVSTQAFNLLPIDGSGQPLMNMIGWMDLRATSQAEKLLKDVDTSRLFQWTGNVPRAKDVIPKILWLREEHPDIWKDTHLLLNCKEYIIHKLTGKHAMDWHSASIFFLFDVRKKQWSQNACKSLGIPLEMLPDTYPCINRIGEVNVTSAKETGLRAGTPVILCPADIAAAQIGCGAVENAQASLSLGTGGWVCVSSDKYLNDPEAPFWALAHVDPDMWIIGAGMDTAGGGLVWLRKLLFNGEIQKGQQEDVDAYQLINQMALSVSPGSNRLIFIPWVYGERGHMGIDHRVRGAFIGLGLEHNKAAMARAVMEGVAFHFRWMIEALEDTGLSIKAINLIGGGSSSSAWIQILSDVTNREFSIAPKPQDVGCIGAAITTSVGLGIRPDYRIIEDHQVSSSIVRPQGSAVHALYEGYYQEYRNICEHLKPIYTRLHKLTDKGSGK